MVLAKSCSMHRRRRARVRHRRLRFAAVNLCIVFLCIRSSLVRVSAFNSTRTDFVQWFTSCTAVTSSYPSYPPLPAAVELAVLPVGGKENRDAIYSHSNHTLRVLLHSVTLTEMLCCILNPNGVAVHLASSWIKGTSRYFVQLHPTTTFRREHSSNKFQLENTDQSPDGKR